MDFVKGPDDPAGAEQRLTRLVEAYQLPLKRMCCIWLGDASLAEDAVQETFLRAYRALPDFRGECSEKTWLCRIAVNVCRNLRRSAWFRHVDRRVDIDALPEASVPFTARDDTLARAIAALPPKQREVVVLYYYQDLRMPEISEALHIAVSSVSRRLEAAKRQLREQLERE